MNAARIGASAAPFGAEYKGEELHGLRFAPPVATLGCPVGAKIPGTEYEANSAASKSASDYAPLRERGSQFSTICPGRLPSSSRPKTCLQKRPSLSFR